MYDYSRFVAKVREDTKAGMEVQDAVNKAIEAAKNLLRMNLGTIEQITQATSLPLGKVREIAQGISAESLSVHS